MRIPTLSRRATTTSPRWLLAMAFSMLLSSCQMVHFSVPPTTAAAGCDPALVGAWSSNPNSETGQPFDLDIDSDCRVQLSENGRAGSPVQLHVAEWPEPGQHVLWLRIGDLPAMFSHQPVKPPKADDPVVRYPDDWMLLCYLVAGEKLYLRFVDPGLLEEGIRGNWVRGEIIGSGSTESLRITDALNQVPLDLHKHFCSIDDPREPMFTRRTTGDTP